jgi:hypothetical protein
VEEQPYLLEVEALELGPNTRAVGIELLLRGTRELVGAPDSGRVWAAALAALVNGQPWVLDFLAHAGRVRDFCRDKGIAFRAPNPRILVIDPPPAELLAALLDRFAAERFGVRAGPAVGADDRELEGALAARGVDAYDGSYRNYQFCAICDFESGFLTILSDVLWASEIIRRIRPAVAALGVEVSRPA